MNLQSAIPAVLPVTSHTDFVGQGSTFVVIKGAKLDGIDYIVSALEKGAKKIVVQNDLILSTELINKINLNNAQLIKVPDCRLALTQLSLQAWQNAAKNLKIIAITGTKGKTTTTYLLHHILRFAGLKTAMISGVHNYINDQKYEACLTTPLPDYLHAFFAQCVQHNVEYVVMEASAQAFTLKRLYGLEFAGIVFTNLDLEHMEFYNSMDEYFAAKCEIFKQLKPAAPVIINVDTQWGQQAAKINNDFVKLSFNTNADFNSQIIKNDSNILEIKVNDFTFSTNKLIGQFNAYNIAGAISLALKLGLDQAVIAQAIKNFSHVPGRMERYKLNNGAMAIIDYAHNPSSMTSLLNTLKPICKKLIVVFGCGGDRDKTKRPIMGDIVSQLADIAIITSDNPRSEKLQDIIEQIKWGVKPENLQKVQCINDREQAIEYAYSISQEGDIIAILGKGPDEYEQVGDKKTYFSDKEVILASAK